MSIERSKGFSFFQRFFRMGSCSLTFPIAIVLISIFVIIEILLASWRLAPGLVHQLSVRWVAHGTSALPGAIFSHSSKQTNTTADAGSILRRAITMENSGQTAQAVALLRNLQAMPNLPSGLQTEVQNHLRTLSVASSQANIASAIQGDEGLPAGSTLGIIECKLMDGKPTGRILRVAMKARPGLSIDVQNVKIHVYFYEKTNDGEVVLTDSPIRSEWLNPPTDWSNGTPQLLDVLYSGPQATSAPNTFYGYIVGIYYNGELQDSRAVPVRLAREFPPPLFLTTGPKN